MWGSHQSVKDLLDEEISLVIAPPPSLHQTKPLSLQISLGGGGDGIILSFRFTFAAPLQDKIIHWSSNDNEKELLPETDDRPKKMSVLVLSCALPHQRTQKIKKVFVTMPDVTCRRLDFFHLPAFSKNEPHQKYYLPKEYFFNLGG